MMQIEDFIIKFDAPTADIARSLRNLIGEHLTDPVETIDQENIGLGIGPGYKGLVFTITPRAGYVMLGVANGASLSDPTSLLQGKGKVHRHIKLYQAAEIENPALEDLIHLAVEAAIARREK